MLVKKECFEKVGLFNEAFPCLEDWEMILRIAKEYSIEFIPEYLMDVYATLECVTNNIEGFVKTKCIFISFKQNESTKRKVRRYTK